MDKSLSSLFLNIPDADQTPRGQAVVVPVRALYDARLSEQALSVLMLLCYQGAFAPNGWFAISHGKIAEWYGIARTTVIDRLRLLESCGYIRMERRNIAGRKVTSVYRVLFDVELDPQHQRAWTVDRGREATISGMSAPPTSQIRDVGSADTDVGPTDTSKSMMSAPPTSKIWDVGGADIIKNRVSSKVIGLETSVLEEEVEEEGRAGNRKVDCQGGSSVTESLTPEDLMAIFAECCMAKFRSAPPVAPADVKGLTLDDVPRSLAAAIIGIVLQRLPSVPRSLRVLSHTWAAITGRWRAALAADPAVKWRDVPGLLDDHTAVQRTAFRTFQELWPRKEGLEGDACWRAFAGACLRASPEAVLDAARSHVGSTEPRFVSNAIRWLRETHIPLAPLTGPTAAKDEAPAAEGVSAEAQALWQSVFQRLDEKAKLMARKATLQPESTREHLVLGCATRFEVDWLTSRVIPDLHLAMAGYRVTMRLLLP
jgi:DNA-binding Lrp family transcriptional regulator